MFWPRWIWLRGLGLIFLSVFYSLAFQIRGLNGPRGILPAGEYLSALRDAAGWRAFWYAPTLFWLGASDRALMAVVLLGAAASVLLVLNVAPCWALLAAFTCFLSFIGAAQDFASYQSDGMLLEAAFVSLFLAPRGLRPGLGAGQPPRKLAAFLLRWEWFRIYFESGVVKLLSGDPQWRSLTAMDHYYENGPLPSWVGWYVQQTLPHGFHTATAALTLALELVLVFCAFLPRRWRIACFLLVSPFQAAIILTANYAFLNYIVLFLGVWLLDDRFLQRVGLPPTIGAPPPDLVSGPPGENLFFFFRGAGDRGARALLAWVLYATVVTAPGLARLLPRPLLLPAQALAPLRIANAYGLFAVMTEDRFEIEFQGSRDGRTWTPYAFRYKPQDPMAAPGIYAPYQPRFEWNLWFASLGDWREYPWVVRTELRLLEGSPEVLQLFAGDPFAGRPPDYVRAVKWQYWFTSPAEKRRTGAWWRREERGLFAPELGLSEGKIRPIELP